MFTLMFASMLAYVPHAEAITYETVYLYVDTFTNTTLEPNWYVEGTTPYVDAIDYDTNYIWYNGMLYGKIGNFAFQNSDDNRPICSVYIQFYATHFTYTGNQFDVYLWNGSQLVTATTILSVGPSWSWKNVTVTDIIGTKDQVNSAYIQMKSNYYVDANSRSYFDAIRLKVTYEVRNWEYSESWIGTLTGRTWLFTESWQCTFPMNPWYFIRMSFAFIGILCIFIAPSMIVVGAKRKNKEILVGVLFLFFFAFACVSIIDLTSELGG